MPRYDDDLYDPPAPVATVRLRRFDDGSTINDVMLLIDTGADTSLLPRAVVERLGVTIPPGQYELVGFDGSRSMADAVEVDVLFLSKAFRGRYLLTDSEHGILGRDVLNSLRLVFDGPSEEWSD
jgi:hypothetical protein